MSARFAAAERSRSTRVKPDAVQEHAVLRRRFEPSVVHNTGARYSVNMFSAVTAKGALRFMVHEGTVNANVFIDFCKRLLHDTSGPVY